MLYIFKWGLCWADNFPRYVCSWVPFGGCTAVRKQIWPPPTSHMTLSFLNLFPNTLNMLSASVYMLIPDLKFFCRVRTQECYHIINKGMEKLRGSWAKTLLIYHSHRNFSNIWSLCLCWCTHVMQKAFKGLDVYSLKYYCSFLNPYMHFKLLFHF